MTLSRMPMQTLIENADALLDANGRLTHRGYSPQPVLRFNPENIRRHRWPILNRMRLKEWDYYGITTPDFFFSACVTNLGYMGLVFVYFIDFRRLEIIDDSIVTPFGRGCRMPHSSAAGDIRFRSRRAEVVFTRQDEQRRLDVTWKGFAAKRPLSAALTIDQPKDHQGIVMATPIGDRTFYYNHKVNSLPTTGSVEIGGEQFELTKQNALACLDWGRGVWPYSTFWIWANASGFLADGSTLGINLGRGFGDLSAATENAFFVDGKLHKLDSVDIRYNTQNHMAPWRFSSEDGRCDLTFTPFFRRRSAINLVLLKSKVNQMFGRYNGTLTGDDGSTIEVDDLVGWAEDHYARW